MFSVAIESFFDPALTIDGKPYSVWKYEQIIKEEVYIMLLSEGGISINDLEERPINDRRLIMSALQQINETKKRTMEDARMRRKANIDSAKANQSHRRK